jgi:hypothetical protein
MCWGFMHKSSNKGHITQAKAHDHVTSCLMNIIVFRNLHQAYHLEVGLMQTLADQETLFTICHVGIYVEFSSMMISLDP